MGSLRNIPRVYVWLVVLIAAGALVGFWGWREFVQTYHLATVQKKVLYRDGFRSLREFETAVRDVDPKTIVSLLDHQEVSREPFSVERDFCVRSRIRYVHVDVPLGGWPTASDVKAFLDAAKDAKHQPVLVHCAQGVRRTGMMVAAYQMSVLGWDKEKTKSAVLTFGHSDRSIGDVKKFIDEYDPATMALPTTMPAGVE